MIALPIGIKELGACKRFWVCFLVLIVSAPALYLKDMDGTAFAAIVSSIVLIYNFTNHLQKDGIPQRGI